MTRTTHTLRTLAVVAVAVVVGACATEPAGVETSGQELYRAECQECHGGATGGDIADLPPPHNAQGHTWHHPDCQLIDIMRDGLPERLGGLPEGVAPMPGFGDRLTDDDLDAILEFIKTWWSEDQRSWQAEVTDQAC